MAQATSDRETLVTLKLQKAPVTEALDELARQSGIAIVITPEGLWRDGRGGQPPTVTVDFTRAPFWIVCSELLRQASLMPVVNNTDGASQITLQRQPGGMQAPLKQSYKDGVLFVAVGVTHAHRLDYTRSTQVVDEFEIA